MVLQCRSGVAALPEYEEIILCGGYGAWVLSAHTSNVSVWLIFVGSAGVSPNDRHNPHTRT